MTSSSRGRMVSPAAMTVEVDTTPVVFTEYLCPVVSSVCWKQDDSEVKLGLLTKLTKPAGG